MTAQPHIRRAAMGGDLRSRAQPREDICISSNSSRSGAVRTSFRGMVQKACDLVALRISIMARSGS